MRVLVACEFSATVRDAFRTRGHDAWSCDLLDTEGDPAWHIVGDCRRVLGGGWDLLIAHPPCTYLARSGARWHWGSAGQAHAARFAADLLAAPVPRIALENPPGALTRLVRPPDETIEPWEFGHAESKRTCLWLVGLPHLIPTHTTHGELNHRVHYAAPGPSRWMERSRTLPGIAAAMADQWGREDLDTSLVRPPRHADEYGSDRCGTYAGLQIHRRRKQKPCPACRAANAAYMRAYRS